MPFIKLDSSITEAFTNAIFRVSIKHIESKNISILKANSEQKKQHNQAPIDMNIQLIWACNAYILINRDSR